MDSSISLLEPYKSSFAYDDTERQLQALFIKLFDDLYGMQIKNIHDYGMPHFGSATVVERFTKQDGLVVLRKSEISDIIMRVIYANWRSLGSKRGLAFLEFVLTMIWGNQWEISRLYHSIERSNEYPALATTEPTINSFLTSRIAITINQEVNADKIREIAPMIAKLVPANIVSKIMAGMDFDDIDDIGMGMAYKAYAAANYQYFEDLIVDRIPFTDWGVARTFDIVGFTVEYNGFRTDLVDTVYALAVVNLAPLALSVMSIAKYQQMQAVANEIARLHPNYDAYAFDNAASAVQILKVPADYTANTADTATVLIARIEASADVSYTGRAEMNAVLDYLGWQYSDGGLKRSGPAGISRTQPHIFKAGAFKSFDTYLDAAQKLMQDLVQNSPEWAERTLDGGLVLDGSTESSETYLQNYSYMTPEPTYTDGIMDAAEFYFTYAYDSQAWKGETADAVFEAFKTYWNDGHADASGNIDGLRSAEIQANGDVVYDPIYASDPDLIQLITVPRQSNPNYDPSAASVPPYQVDDQFTIVSEKVPNPDFAAEDAQEVYDVTAIEKSNVFLLALAIADEEESASNREMIYAAMKQAYFQDTAQAATNALYTANIQALAYSAITGSMQTIFAAAVADTMDYIWIHAFLSEIAESVYSSNPADQLITLTQLRVLFNANTGG
ncbi:hypothetical protein [Acinetobacter sp. ANC 3813]|uniref:hypothetical protein n=1 Tax=Acinetobacter sp. ANC 3813 TaxID=1977873 RepID=UPI000A352776|nr:hypothetical protein [Acinetobacter sp. ANC 3813]